MTKLARVCVYCGASAGHDPAYRRAAERFGAALVRRGIALVYGGGSVGIMGALADAVLAAGGTAIGVIPRALMERELAHQRLTELHVTASMHERKALMAELADAFVALPGGIGTLEELFEIWTWAQLGLHGKPCGWLDVNGYYGKLAAFLDLAVEQGFVQARDRARLLTAAEPDELLAALAAYRAPHTERWVRREEL